MLNGVTRRKSGEKVSRGRVQPSAPPQPCPALEEGTRVSENQGMSAGVSKDGAD